MKNMEREKFEESCRRAFDEAAISPSVKVWTNIELELERARGGELKRRLLFYQMLAAASVVFAMAIGGAGYYFALDHNAGLRQPSMAQVEQIPSGGSQEALPSTSRQSAPTPETLASADTFSPANSRHDTGVTTRADNTSNMLMDESAAPLKDESKTPPVLPVQISDTELPPLYAAREVTLTFRQEQQEVDPVVAMLAKLERREREVQNEEKDKTDKGDTENLWTSIGFAAGSFNAMQAPSASGSSGSASRLAMAAAPIVDQESKATGYSYSMGVNVGTKISERWVLQGGVNYLTHASEYTANNVVVDGPGFLMAAEKYKPIATNAIVSADSEYELSNSIVYSAPYNVNNSMRYLSIPVQAGYLLINKAFGLQLNAGVATDLFLQNTVKGDGDQLGETTQPLGSDSPYRTVNLSGLFGTEVSYRFSPRYRVSLNPGIRYPFNTIYKSELGVHSSPLTFDVGLRFRYIFN